LGLPAPSNFVTDAPNLVGFDPFVPLGKLIERRWSAARAEAGKQLAGCWPTAKCR